MSSWIWINLVDRLLSLEMQINRKLLFILPLGAMLLAWSSLQAKQLKRKAIIIDAQTLILAGETLRLAHIHTPRPGETCPFKDRTMRCGRIAATALMDLTAGATVVCHKYGRDAANRQLARCWADGYELSEGMVYTGWARAAKSAPAKFHKVEKNAQARRRGLWKGAFPNSVQKALAQKTN